MGADFFEKRGRYDDTSVSHTEKSVPSSQCRGSEPVLEIDQRGSETVRDARQSTMQLGLVILATDYHHVAALRHVAEPRPSKCRGGSELKGERRLTCRSVASNSVTFAAGIDSDQPLPLWIDLPCQVAGSMKVIQGQSSEPVPFESYC